MPLLNIAEVLFLLTIILFFLIQSWHCRWSLELPGLLGMIPPLRLSSVHALLPSCSLTGHKAAKVKLCPKTEQKHHFVQKKLGKLVLFLFVGGGFWLGFVLRERYSLFWLQLERPIFLEVFRKELLAGFVCTDTESSLPPSSGAFSLTLGSSFRQTHPWAMGFSRPYFAG